MLEERPLPASAPSAATIAHNSQVETEAVDILASQFNEVSEDMVLYEDKCCRITKTGILLKTYYFPFGGEKMIPMANILQVTVHAKFWMSSTWGLSDTHTWWCRDFSRKQGGACIIVRTAAHLMKGFSPNAGNKETTRQVGELMSKIIDGGPGMVKTLGY